MERPDPEQQRRWLSSALPPIELITVRRLPPRALDAWRLDHPYVAAPDLASSTIWANLRTFVELGSQGGAHPNHIAHRLELTTHEMIDGIATSVFIDQFHVTRTGDAVTISTSTFAPSYTPERERVDHAAHELADRYDPHRLTLPATTDRPPAYDIYRVPATPQQSWPLDSKYARGVWGAYLGHNANKLFGILAAELDEPSPVFAVRGIAHGLRISPNRLQAELDHLHRHGIIDLDHHRGTIATSGRIGPPPREILDAHRLVAISHRSLVRTGQAAVRASPRAPPLSRRHGFPALDGDPVLGHGFIARFGVPWSWRHCQRRRLG